MLHESERSNMPSLGGDDMDLDLCAWSIIGRLWLRREMQRDEV